MITRVANRLAQIRKSRGVGASILARRVGVSRQTIYAIEARREAPTPRLFRIWARRFATRVITMAVSF